MKPHNVLDVKQRTAMMKMIKDADYSAESKRNAAKYFDIDIRTVRNHVMQYRINGKVAPKKSTGRKPVFNEDVKQYVLDLVKAHSHITLLELANATNIAKGVKPSPGWLSVLLTQKDLRSYVAKRKPLISPLN